MFGSCFRTLAVILVSILFVLFVCLFVFTTHIARDVYSAGVRAVALPR